jgi:hypothetical protein
MCEKHVRLAGASNEAAEDRSILDVCHGKEFIKERDIKQTSKRVNHNAAQQKTFDPFPIINEC